MTQFLGGDGEKKAPKKPVAAVKQLDAFESLIDGLGSGAVTERKSVDLVGGLGFANEAPSGPKVAPTPRSMTYDDVSPMPLWSAGVDLEASIGGGGDDMGMGFGMAHAPDDEPDAPAGRPAGHQGRAFASEGDGRSQEEVALLQNRCHGRGVGGRSDGHGHGRGQARHHRSAAAPRAHGRRRVRAVRGPELRRRFDC